MKNNFIIFIFFFLLGCMPNTSINTKTKTKISCPNVFFASEHSNYIAGNEEPITSENISYKAEINNYAFNNECSINDEEFQAELTLLFIVKPNLVEENNINLPFYVAILNANDELVDMQYYQVDGNLNSEPDDVNYFETELIKTIKLQIPSLNDQEHNQNKVIVGFMLDKKKLKILN